MRTRPSHLCLKVSRARKLLLLFTKSRLVGDASVKKNIYFPVINLFVSPVAEIGTTIILGSIDSIAVNAIPTRTKEHLSERIMFVYLRKEHGREERSGLIPYLPLLVLSTRPQAPVDPKYRYSGSKKGSTIGK